MNKDEEKQLADLLSKLEAGFLPYDIFVQMARLNVLSIVEFVPLRLQNGQVEVLLLERPEDDKIWPLELHTPGTVIRPTDNGDDHYKPFERIQLDELNGTALSPPHYVGNILHSSKRGVEQAQVFWVEVTGQPKIGEFYPVDKLPDRFMDSQRKFVLQAAEDFKQNNRSDS